MVPTNTVVIDGLNVARDKGFLGAREGGDARALRAAIEHFLTLGHEVLAIVPNWALKSSTKRLAHAEVLSPYLRRQLHPSPSGVDDDNFLLALAKEKDGLLLSNDLFRDALSAGTVARGWLHAHRLAFMFVEQSLLVQPAGRNGSSASAATPATVATNLSASSNPKGTGRARPPQHARYRRPLSPISSSRRCTVARNAAGTGRSGSSNSSIGMRGPGRLCQDKPVVCSRQKWPHQLARELVIRKMLRWKEDR